MRTWRFTRLVRSSTSVSYDDIERLAAAIARDSDNSNGVPAAYTYFGQFIAHDLTELRRPPVVSDDGELDLSLLGQARKPVLDLDSIYGAGLDDSIVPYERETGKFVLGRTAARSRRKRHRDLPRRPDGTPLIPEARNDENLLVAQMHVMFLHFHNRLIEHYQALHGANVGAEELFGLARREAILTYQSIVLFDFARRLLPSKVFDAVVTAGEGRLLKRDKTDPAIAVEFSGAAFRMGHSMVQDRYDFGGSARIVEFADLFGMTGRGILSDDVLLPERMIVPWRKFLQFESNSDPSCQIGRSDNQASRVDTSIADAMRHIPHHCGHGNIIAVNLQRGKELQLATGQEVCTYLLSEHSDVAEKVDLAAVPPEELLNDIDIESSSTLRSATPLWAYVLSEARHYVRENGPQCLATLGTLGGWIVADGLRAAMEMAETSLSDEDWTPATSVVGTSVGAENRPGRTLTLEDVVRYAYPDDRWPERETTTH